MLTACLAVSAATVHYGAHTHKASSFLCGSLTYDVTITGLNCLGAIRGRSQALTFVKSTSSCLGHQQGRPLNYRIVMFCMYWAQACTLLCFQDHVLWGAGTLNFKYLKCNAFVALLKLVYLAECMCCLCIAGWSTGTDTYCPFGESD